MQPPNALDESELSILVRIALGVKPVTSRETRLTRTVYALQDRKLVVLTRTKGFWSAALTESGRLYLENGNHLPAPDANEPDKDEPAIDPEDFLRQLIDAGGTLRISDPDEVARRLWWEAAQAARRDGLIPDGYHLTLKGRDQGDLEIRLKTGGPHQRHVRYRSKDRRPVHVPQHLQDLHSVVAELRDDQLAFALDGSARERGLRLFQAIADEATRCCYKVRRPGDYKGGHLEVVIGDEGWAVAIQRQELATRLASQSSSTRKSPDDVDVPPAQRLRLRLWQWPGGGSCDWYDGDESTLESQLWQVIVHMEKATRDICHAVAMMDGGRSPEERQRERDELRREWETARTLARERVLTQGRLQVLTTEVDAWQRARTIRQYADELTSVLSTITDEDHRRSLADWIDWMKSYAGAIDPITEHPGFPRDRTVDPDELIPHLSGFSPYNPPLK
ncbi:hypothetical protein HII36_09840 [Nonomuraea sp. NN258]|uniref:hypothetical protein n=1 Tax=Nonomuraea antri TaxID=2730852 RepID=UPI00156828DC|nr:hypothetical protein [Nonomuraea antri]NRQ32137.1 hypothetical protein [Nonomuraea antri]